MSASAIEEYGEVSADLNPVAVSQYLAANGWELEWRDESREIWRQIGGESRALARLMLPIDTGFADFPERFREILYALGRIYDWDAGQLHDSIVATHADLLYVRLGHSSNVASIPLQQAVAAMDVLYDVLRATAAHVADVGGSDPGKGSSNMTRYLEDDLRMGHTRRGGFTFTVMSRLSGTADAEVPDPPCFARRVMETMSAGIGAAKDAVDFQNDAGSVLERSEDLVIGVDLVSFLEELAWPDSLREVDLSFGWATAGPPVRSKRNRIVLDRPSMRKFPAVRRALERSSTASTRRVALVGTIRTLMSDQDSSESGTGALEMLAEVDGKSRIVEIPFDGDQRALVVDAYRENFKLLAVGDLMVGARRIWTLTGNIQLIREGVDDESVGRTGG